MTTVGIPKRISVGAFLLPESSHDKERTLRVLEEAGCTILLPFHPFEDVETTMKITAVEEEAGCTSDYLEMEKNRKTEHSRDRLLEQENLAIGPLLVPFRNLNPYWAQRDLSADQLSSI